jgi:hypothetical protein
MAKFNKAVKGKGAVFMWELRFFFYRVLPIAIALAFVFLFFFSSAFIQKDEVQLFIMGFLINAGGIYIMRLIGWLVNRRLTKKPEVQEDIYVAPEK